MTTFEIHSSNVEAFETKIDAANRRLARHNIDGRFVANLVGQRSQEKDGLVETWFEYEFEAPKIGYGDWVFSAVVRFEEGGTFLSTAPGETLPQGYTRPDDHICEHCNVRRTRVKSYLLRNTRTGEIKQVGSNCLELFLGVEIKGLWVLSYTEEEFASMADPAEDWLDGGGYRNSPAAYSVDYLLRMAWVLSNGGRRFKSRAAAMHDDESSTADRVLYVINWRPIGRNAERERHYISDMRRQASEVDPSIIETLREFGYTLGESDYAQNMRVCLDSTAISYRSVGTLVSLVGSWYKTQEREERQKVESAAYVPEFVGAIKERLRGLDLIVTKVKEIEHDYGVSTLLLFKDSENHAFKWFKSGMADLEIGQEVKIDATVKDHEIYEGVHQTVVTRGKILS